MPESYNAPLARPDSDEDRREAAQFERADNEGAGLSFAAAGDDPSRGVRSVSASQVTASIGAVTEEPNTEDRAF